MIFPIGTWDAAHSSTVLALGGGDLLASWFAGSEENAPDVAIYTARYSAEAAKWEAPREVVAPFDRANGTCAKSKGGEGCKFSPSVWNPVLASIPLREGDSGTGGAGDGGGSRGGVFGLKTGAGGGGAGEKGGGREILLFYKTGGHPSEWIGHLARSRDGGRTWSTPHERLPEGFVGPSKNKPLLVPATGSLLVPSSRESGRGVPREWRLVMEETADGGRTWEKRAPMRFDGNAIQPALWVGGDGRVRMLARSASDYDIKTGKRADPVKQGKTILVRGRKYIVAAVSSDLEGREWGLVKPTTLPCPNSGIDVVKLRDGRVVVIYNHSWEAKGAGRGRLNVAISTDDGVTWKRSLVLEDKEGKVDPGSGKPIEMSYPAVIQDQDTGLVHVTYSYNRQSIKHVVLDPEHL